MSTPSTPRRRGPAPRYTREHIFETALRVIDDGDPDTFSLRRLADALGVTAMSLYGYAKDKNELIEGAAHIAISAAHQNIPADATWQQRLTADMNEIHTVMRRHPNLAILVIGRRLKAPSLFRIRERTLTTLLDAGFDQTTALNALGALTYYALGFATGQAAIANDEPDDVLPDLDPAAFPQLTATGSNYRAHASDDAFAYGLKHLIAGIARELPESNPADDPSPTSQVPDPD